MTGTQIILAFMQVWQPIFILFHQISFMLFKYYSADSWIMSYHDIITWNGLFVSNLLSLK